MSITAVNQQPCYADATRRPASRTYRASHGLAAIVAVAAGLTVAAPASAAELVSNGGFETGTFSDWTITQPTNPLAPWSVVSALDPGGFASPSPPHGTYDARNGFDGSPGHFTLSQTISIPAAVTASLTWQDRLQYSHAGQPRLLQVKILNAATDALLATPYTYTTQTGTLVDTGWQSHSVDLSAFSGQTVKLVFDETIPENFTGPAQAELDAISVQTTPTTADPVGDPVREPPPGAPGTRPSLCPRGTSGSVRCYIDPVGRLAMVGTNSASGSWAQAGRTGSRRAAATTACTAAPATTGSPAARAATGSPAARATIASRAGLATIASWAARAATACPEAPARTCCPAARATTASTAALAVTACAVGQAATVRVQPPKTASAPTAKAENTSPQRT